MSKESFFASIQWVYETALNKIVPDEESNFKEVIRKYIIGFFVSEELFLFSESVDLSGDLDISLFKDAVMTKLKHRTLEMINNHPEFSSGKYIDYLNRFMVATFWAQFKYPEFSVDDKIDNAYKLKELFLEEYLITTNKNAENFHKKAINHIDYEIEKYSYQKNESPLVSSEESIRFREILSPKQQTELVRLIKDYGYTKAPQNFVNFLTGKKFTFLTVNDKKRHNLVYLLYRLYNHETKFIRLSSTKEYVGYITKHLKIFSEKDAKKEFRFLVQEVQKSSKKHQQIKEEVDTIINVLAVLNPK